LLDAFKGIAANVRPHPISLAFLASGLVTATVEGRLRHRIGVARPSGGRAGPDAGLALGEEWIGAYSKSSICRQK
jgi:hypothetical protein